MLVKAILLFISVLILMATWYHAALLVALENEGAAALWFLGGTVFAFIAFVFAFSRFPSISTKPLATPQ